MQKKDLELSQYQYDEIDFFELVDALWHRKWLIILVTFTVIALAVTYLVATPKVYEAKVLISKAQAVNIAQLNVGRAHLGDYAQSISPDSAYALFYKKLQSKRLKLDYFRGEIEPVYRENSNVNATSRSLYESFLKSISIVGTIDDIYLTVKYQYTDPALAAQRLNGYLRFVEKKTKGELIDSALYNKTQAVNEYQKEIASLKAVYSRRLQDKVVQLEEAYGIAKKLNFQKPVASKLTDKIASSVLDESLLYMRGYEVLKAEIEVLKGRRVLEPFIEKIRPIQEKISYLESVEYDIEKLDVLSVDAWATSPEYSIKPRKLLILTFAGLIGGVLGVVITLVLLVISKRKVG